MTTEQRIAVIKRFRVIFGSVRHHFREVEKASGVTGSQLWVLHEVSKNGGIGVSDLAERLSVHQSTCSQLVEKLVRSGHVRKMRISSDQRSVELRLTEKGRRAIARATTAGGGVLPEAIGELAPRELRRLDAGLARIIQGLDLKDDYDAGRPLSDL